MVVAEDNFNMISIFVLISFHFFYLDSYYTLSLFLSLSLSLSYVIIYFLYSNLILVSVTFMVVIHVFGHSSKDINLEYIFTMHGKSWRLQAMLSPFIQSTNFSIRQTYAEKLILDKKNGDMFNTCSYFLNYLNLLPFFNKFNKR